MWHKLFPLVYERYLAKQIYLAFVFILFALISLFIFFDFIAEMGDTTNTYTVLLAFITVLLRVPSRLVEIMPIAGLIAGLIGGFTGIDALFTVAVGFALGAAFLNAAFNYCLGCEMYLIGLRLTSK